MFAKKMKSAACPARSNSPSGELLVGLGAAIFPGETVFAVFFLGLFLALT